MWEDATSSALVLLCERLCYVLLVIGAMSWLEVILDHQAGKYQSEISFYFTISLKD